MRPPILHMSLLIFHFWTATVLTLDQKAIEIQLKYGRIEAQFWPLGAEEIIIF